MPQYAPDLTAYLYQFESRKPTAVLQDPVLLQRALSKESPIGLVASVAKSLENKEEHPAITALSTYEKGRVMSATGQHEDATRLYKEALAACTDPQIRGQILVNLAGDATSATEKIGFLQQAIKEGHDEAYAHLGIFYHTSGDANLAMSFLLTSVEKGVTIGIPTISELICRTKRGNELETAFTELMAKAHQAGIEDPIDAPFIEEDLQNIPRSGLRSMVHRMARAEIKRVFTMCVLK